MRMKKLLCSVCVIVTVAVLGACGGNQTPAESAGGNETVVTEQPEQKELERTDEEKDTEKEEVSSEDKTAEDEEKLEEKEDVKMSEEEEDKKVEEEIEESFNVLPTIEETVLWDEQGVKIFATGLTYTSYNVQVSLQIENKGEETVSVIAGSAGYGCNAVNGYMIAGGYLNKDIPAGKIAKETISFSMDELGIYGIKEIADIQIGFQIGIGEEKDFYTGSRTLRTSIADSYDYTHSTYREMFSSGALERNMDCVVDEYKEEEFFVMDGVAIESYALVTNSKNKKMLFLELKNNTEEAIRCDAVGLHVNDLCVYKYSMVSNFIAPNCVGVMSFSLDSRIEESYRVAFGLSSYDKLGFTIKVRNEAYTELLAEQEICLELNETVSQIDFSGTEVFRKDGIRIVSKGLFEDSSEKNEDIHLLLLVENDYSEAVRLENVYDSLSVNGFMTDYSLYSGKIGQGERFILDIEIDADSLTDNGVGGIEDISEVEVSMEFKTLKYKDIAEVTVELEF